ncbi:glycosyltransferase family 2 protein [Celerinatantimonas yamalensis]|uniref:Glycosyltransferase n=1 Tax=Celerinatantimonas yamalensis TaxID=559956 RepID=A0ABW9G5J7_9GAMM
MKVIVIVPTRNAGFFWKSWCQSIKQQKGVDISVCNIDSSSKDSTIDVSQIFDFHTKVISPADFNHGGTRNCAFEKWHDNRDVVIFLTQDSLLYTPNSIENLLYLFKDLDVAAVCGRQLPHDDANPLAKHARLFNYPSSTRVMSKSDIEKYGIKTAFVSNSFTAYRASVFKELGGFPEDVILSEDMHLAARIILAGYKVAYAGNACVKHSHNYTPWQEFKRYFDIGVFHATESWIQQEFGGAGGEGKRFIISEFKYLIKNAPLWIPRACITNLCKIIGYKLGKNFKKIPKYLRPKLSMHKAYWSQKVR